MADVTVISDRTGKIKKPKLAEIAPVPVGGVPWRAVLESKGREEALAGLGAEERGAAELFADLYAFSTALERFIVSIVQNLRSPGVGTESLQLPGARTSIARHSRDLLAGKPPRPEALKEYLTAVETWLVAAVADAAVPIGLVRFIGVSELSGALGLILPAATRVLPRLTPAVKPKSSALTMRERSGALTRSLDAEHFPEVRPQLFLEERERPRVGHGIL